MVLFVFGAHARSSGIDTIDTSTVSLVQPSTVSPLPCAKGSRNQFQGRIVSLAITQAGSVRSACNFFCSTPRTSTYRKMYNAWRMCLSNAQYSALNRCKPLHKSHINLCINAKHYVTFFTPVRT